MSSKLIFETSRKGRRGASLPACDVPEREVSELLPPQALREDAAELPEVSELDVIRHYVGLSRRNFGVDNGFYPLGSCTMKYNPKVNEDIAHLPGFSRIHPYQEESSVQGALELLYNLEHCLSEICGVDRFSLQPAAGAQGEFIGLLIIKAYHQSRGEGEVRSEVIVPDSAHGTNPASCTMAGFNMVQVKSDDRGNVDLAELRAVVSKRTAALMLTNPSTLGLFDEHILDIADIVHEAGGLLYYDGANANAIVGVVRPGDMGFDVVHLNLHKTFSTPHGGGGPGSGPVGVKKNLTPFLPAPAVEKRGNGYFFDYNRPQSIGKIHSFYGNFGMLVRAYTYIRHLGAEGLRDNSHNAVLNANYVMHRLKEYYRLPYDRTCMHECVLSADRQKEKGVNALDIAKRVLDFGFHPPTIYFPLVVPEALMIEPTEVESKDTLEAFIETMITIAKEVEENPEIVKDAPYSMPVTRLDEATAARKPNLRWDGRF